MYDWKDADHKTSYYYHIDTGRIVGQIYNLAHTNIYGSKIMRPENNEEYLGQFITMEHAKKAIQEYWLMQSRTLIDHGQ